MTMVISSLIFGMLLLIIHISLGIWVFRDMMKRSNRPLWALGFTAIVWLFPIVGFIVYLSLRKHKGLLQQ